MTESLIIQLRDGASPQWMVCNDDGHVVVEAVSGELAQATAMSTGRRVAVILPAGEALATDSDAPAKGAAKLAQVIPYALEERVADEIENLHFAIGDRDSATGPRSGRGARACASSTRGWPSCAPRALNPQAIYSEATLLPAMPGQMIGLLEGDTLTLRTADAPPLVLPALSITDAFEMALSTQTSAVAGLEPAPLGLLLYAGHDGMGSAPAADRRVPRSLHGHEGAAAAPRLAERARAGGRGRRRGEPPAGRAGGGFAARARLAFVARGRGARPPRCSACTSVRACSN